MSPKKPTCQTPNDVGRPPPVRLRSVAAAHPGALRLVRHRVLDGQHHHGHLLPAAEPVRYRGRGGRLAVDPVRGGRLPHRARLRAPGRPHPDHRVRLPVEQPPDQPALRLVHRLYRAAGLHRGHRGDGGRAGDRVRQRHLGSRPRTATSCCSPTVAMAAAALINIISIKAVSAVNNTGRLLRDHRIGRSRRPCCSSAPSSSSTTTPASHPGVHPADVGRGAVVRLRAGRAASRCTASSAGRAPPTWPRRPTTRGPSPRSP